MQNPPPQLILWDIDSTLISMGIDPFTSFDRTMSRMFTEPKKPQENFHGTTDSYIMRAYLKENGTTEAEFKNTYERAVQIYLDEMKAMQAELLEKGRRLPGAQEAIDAFQAAGVHCTVLTGNYRRAAELKLGTFGVTGIEFSTGAYGRLVSSGRRNELSELL